MLKTSFEFIGAKAKDFPERNRSARALKDPAWVELVRYSSIIVQNDADENAEMFLERRDGHTPHGCSMAWEDHDEEGSNWRCKYYLGGVMRTIAKGTLFQCAKFYDYALVFFDKYRVRKDPMYRRFNFDELTAKAEMQAKPDIARYFESLEEYLLKIGELPSPEKLKEKRESGRLMSQRKWQKKQGGTYQVLERIRENTEEIVRLNSEVAEVAKQQKENTRLLQQILNAQKI